MTPTASLLTRDRRAEQRMLFGLALPTLLVIGVVVFLPVLWLFSLSFLDRAGLPTTENYARVLSSLYYETYLVTSQISLVVTLACVVLGYPLAYWLSRLPPGLAGVLMIFVLLPFWTSVLVRTYAWLVLLQRRGVVNQVLQGLGIIDAPLQLANNLTGSIIGMVHIMLPFLVLPLYAAMRGIDGDLVRASMSLGSSPAGAFWRVFVPMSLPGLFAGVVLVFILSLGFYVTPALLGGGRVQMIAQRIEATITLYTNWGAASALGAVLLAAAFGLVVLLHRVFGLDRLFVR